MGDGPIKLSLQDRIAIWQEMAIYWIVWRIMPRWMAYHAFSRVWTAADEERSAERPYDSSPMTCEEAMRRWEGESPYAAE